MSHSSRRFWAISGWGIKVTLAALLCCGVCFAQFSAGVQGIVQDQSDAVVPNAKLTLVNTATNVKYTAVSAQTGDYRFVSLPPGSYSVSATAPGFATTRVDVRLETAQTVNVPISLGVSTQLRNPAEADQHSWVIAIRIPGDSDQCSWGKRSAFLREADQ